MASRLSQMQARFQQKQMQEKEEKLLKMYENQQQRVFERVGRGSAGSDVGVTLAAGKVRQMFDERRQKAGIDRSYPLEPISKHRTTSLERKPQPPPTKATRPQQKLFTSERNSKPLATRRETIQRLNGNNNSYNVRGEDNHGGDELDNYSNSQEDLVLMMNNHNLGDNLLKDEEFEEPPAYIGKLSNVGGKLPSQNINQNGVPKKTPPSENKTRPNNSVRSINSPPKKESKPILKSKSTKPRPPSATSPSKQSLPSSPSTMNKRVESGGDRSSRPPTKTKPPNVVQRDDLAACRFCQRRFASDRLQVHEDICSKTAKKRRKAYDATKHRVAGTELEPYCKKGVKATSKTAAHHEHTTKPVNKVKASSSKTNWRQQHEEFISAIRAAKQAQAHIAKGGNIRDLPPPPPSSNPDYVQCPHCGRRFNETAAERHIPKCATYQFNKTAKPSQSKISGSGRNKR